VTLALAGGVGATLREARIARQQAEIARQERTRAEQRFNDVRELSDSLIFDVHDAIQNLPGATPARKLLLDRAVEYLDRVAKDSGGEPDLQRELAWGYQRLAVVQGSPTESNLGDPQAAEASNRKATALFEAVAKANPDNIIDQLNVAMGHRILAFSSLLEPSGRRDLEQAMTITERLLKIDGANPKVRSERSIEYQNLGYMYDGVGERAQALAAFQKNLEIKKDLFKTTPGYRRIREGIGVASVIVADEQVKLGSRQEAMPKMQTAIELFESVLKDSPDIDINVARELEITRLKIGELQLMDGQSAAAQATFHQVRAKLAPMAKSDPENSMLQLDMAAIDYEDGKILVSTGRYAAAVAPLQDAIKTFESLHTQTRSGGDIGSGVGDFYIWLGEAQAGMHRPEEALKDYQKAAADLESIKPMGDDTRCALATAEVKIANTLLQIGKPREALAEYTKALSNTDVSAAIQRRDIPALYPVADAYAGLGDASFTLAREAASAKEQSQQWKGARDSYAQSLSTWHEIPNPSRITPNGFRAGDPHDVARKLSDIEKNKTSLAGSA
jgi:tetratricopeptide (TPR) repeat protein